MAVILPHKEVNVHVEDRGYQFADGVYEVILVKNRLLVDEIPHLDRLERSLRSTRNTQSNEASSAQNGARRGDK